MRSAGSTAVVRSGPLIVRTSPGSLMRREPRLPPSETRSHGSWLHRFAYSTESRADSVEALRAVVNGFFG